MASPKTLFLIRLKISQVWNTFCQVLVTTVSLSAGYPYGWYPRHKGLIKTWNLPSNVLPAHNPSTWSALLPSVEYACNSLIGSTTGMSPFVVALGSSKPTPAVVGKCKRQLVQLSPVLLPGLCWLPSITCSLITTWTYPSKRNPVNWHQAILLPMSLVKSLIRPFRSDHFHLPWVKKKSMVLLFGIGIYYYMVWYYFPVVLYILIGY